MGIEPIGWEVNTLDYCLQHVPQSRLAQLNKHPIYSQDPRFPKRKCFVCNKELR